MKQLFIIGLMLVLSTSCVSKKKFLQEVEQKEGFNKTSISLAAKLQQAEQQNQLLEQDNKELSDSLLKLQFNSAQIKRTNENLGNEVNKLTEEIIVLKQRYDLSLQEQKIADEKRDQYFIEIQKETQWKQQVVKELFAKIEATVQPFSNQLVLKREADQIRIEINHSFLFNRTQLNKPAIELLDAIRESFKKQPLVEIWVVGHTAKAVSKSTNTWELAYQRAALVGAYLSEQIPASNILLVSRGDSVPVANNDSKEGKALNNRIELQIQPRLDEMYRMRTN